MQPPLGSLKTESEHARLERAAVWNAREVQFHQPKREFVKWL